MTAARPARRRRGVGRPARRGAGRAAPSAPSGSRGGRHRRPAPARRRHARAGRHRARRDDGLHRDLRHARAARLGVSHAGAALDEARPDLVVLVDYPEFNLRLAKQAKRRGIPVFYFVAPQVWAWRKGRIRTIAERVDKLAAVFPFEPASTTATGSRWRSSSAIRCSTSSPPPAVARRPAPATASPPTGRCSRSFPAAARRRSHLLSRPCATRPTRLAPDGWQSIAALAESLAPADLEAALAGGAIPVPVAHNDTYNVVAAADAAIVASGHGDRSRPPSWAARWSSCIVCRPSPSGSLAAWSTSPGSACPTSSSDAESSRS